MDAREPVAVALDDAERRPARALDARRPELALREPVLGRGRADGPAEQPLEQLERLLELDLPLLEPRLDVAEGAGRSCRSESVVRETRARGTRVLLDPRGPRGGAGRAEPARVARAHDADAGQPVLEGAIEEELAPARRRLGPEVRELGPRGHDRLVVE